MRGQGGGVKQSKVYNIASIPTRRLSQIPLLQRGPLTEESLWKKVPSNEKACNAKKFQLYAESFVGELFLD